LIEMRRFIAILLVIAGVVCIWQTTALAQCAMCVTALENSPEGRAMAASFNNGILFLLAVPYAVFGTVGFIVFRAHRRKKADERQANPYITKK